MAKTVLCIALSGILLFLGGSPAGGQEKPRLPVKVQMDDEKVEIVEAELPVDTTQRIRYNFGGNFYINVQDEMGRTLHLSHFPTIKVDDIIHFPGNGPGRFEVANGALPKTPSGKARQGYQNVWVIDDIRVTQTVELTPTKSPGPGLKRRLDAVLVRYSIENKGPKARAVGLRTYVDTFIVDNDACLFAVPTRPDKILDGVEFTGKDVPPYVQVLQRPNLKDPGFVAHLTFNLGLFDKVDRVILTRHGAARDNWDMNVIGGGGDSALGFFWNPKEVKAGGKRELAYAYGQGLASPVSSEGRFQIVFAGSFEKGKTFSISALVADAVEGQVLELELPKGLERLEGRERQPVPLPLGDTGYSMVLWKGRVLEYGRHPIRIRSSTGVTQTKVVTLTPS